MRQKGTGISWAHYFGPGTGVTWNPIIATNHETGERGWACVKHNADCLNCYASHLNATKIRGVLGTGLEYTRANLDKVELSLSVKGKSAITWPLSLAKPHGIFPCSMTEWISEFTPEWMTDQIFWIMRNSRQHAFFPLTKRHELLAKYLVNELLPEDEIPQNVIFGVTIGSKNTFWEAAHSLVKIKTTIPTIKLWVSYEPAIGEVDWRGLEGIIDWLVMGAESKQGKREPREMDEKWIDSTSVWCENNNVPFYFKQYKEKRREPLVHGRLYQQFPKLKTLEIK